MEVVIVERDDGRSDDVGIVKCDDEIAPVEGSPEDVPGGGEDGLSSDALRFEVESIMHE